VLGSGIDAIVAPSYTFATQPAAVAGYPNIAIPCGLLEQSLQPRTQPTYTGTLQPFPPDPGICAGCHKLHRRPAVGRLTDFTSPRAG